MIAIDSSCSIRLAGILALTALLISFGSSNCNPVQEAKTIASNALLRRRANNNAVVCRVTHENTLWPDGNQLNRERIYLCSPIVNGQMLSIDTAIALPPAIAKDYHEELARGILIVAISGAILNESGAMILGFSPSYHVENDSSYNHHRQRHLLEPTGTRTVTIVRISTQSQEHSDSLAHIQETIFGGVTSFVTQMEDCSHGKLKIEQSEHGIIDLVLPQSNADYDNDSTKLVAAAQEYLVREGYGPGAELSDVSIFCLPEGFGSWAARAPMNHWRITMNHGWCLSLSAAMHEHGHLMNLGHALNEMAGYMGPSYSNSTWPRKCYNGYNNHRLGWYDDRKVNWDEGMTSLKLATFVDFDKASPDEAVIVNIFDKFFLQYNVKKEFNEHDGGIEWQGAGLVYIHKPLSAEDTELVATLSVGESFQLSDPNVYVKACESYQVDGGAEGMFLSFAFEVSNLCVDELMFAPEAEARDAVQSQEEGGNVNASTIENVQSVEEDSSNGVEMYNGQSKEDTENPAEDGSSNENKNSGAGTQEQGGGNTTYVGNDDDGNKLGDLANHSNTFDADQPPSKPPVDNPSLFLTLLELLRNFLSRLYSLAFGW